MDTTIVLGAIIGAVLIIFWFSLRSMWRDLKQDLETIYRKIDKLDGSTPSALELPGPQFIGERRKDKTPPQFEMP